MSNDNVLATYGQSDQLRQEIRDGIRETFAQVIANIETLRHRANNETVSYADLRNGDVTWVAGTAMVVGNLRSYPGSRGPVIRFNGTVLNDPQYLNTGFDGGVYGGGSWVLTTIVCRSLVRELTE